MFVSEVLSKRANLFHPSPSSIGLKQGCRWQQTMLRIKDPKRSIPFYERLGCRLVHRYDFEQWKFSLYFMETPRPGVKGIPEWGKSSPEETEKYLWNDSGVTLELTHNWGTEDDDSFKVSSGNEEPYRGFGHTCFHVNVDPEQFEDFCFRLKDGGVQFRKLPSEGRMRGLAFAVDPDGYWVEMIPRNPEAVNDDIPEFQRKSLEEEFPSKMQLSQTMLRVSDIQKSLEFYIDHLGFSLVRASDYSDFSLYFLAHLTEEEKKRMPPPTSPEGRVFVHSLWQPALELTYNHTSPPGGYHNGNSEVKGFGHIGCLVEDLDQMCSSLIESGVDFQKKPSDGSMRNIAFAKDPDGYWVELVQKGTSFKAVASNMREEGA